MVLAAHGPAMPSHGGSCLIAIPAPCWFANEWNSERHAGVDEFGIGEFLTQDGGPQNALLALLFGQATANGTAA